MEVAQFLPTRRLPRPLMSNSQVNTFYVKVCYHNVASGALQWAHPGQLYKAIAWSNTADAKDEYWEESLTKRRRWTIYPSATQTRAWSKMG